jgi:hypothetical protein
MPASRLVYPSERAAIFGPRPAIEIVHQAFAELRSGQYDGGVWDPDVEVINAAGWVIETTYRGHAGLRRWWEDIAEAFGDFGIELDEAVPVDEERVLTTQGSGTARSCGPRAI